MSRQPDDQLFVSTVNWQQYMNDDEDEQLNCELKEEQMNQIVGGAAVEPKPSEES